MRIGMRGFNQSAGIGGGGRGMGFTTGDTSWWQTLTGDLARGWTNIAGQILTPPTYSQTGSGVEIRGGAPVLQTSLPAGYGAGGAVPVGGYGGAGMVTGFGTGGVSNTGLMMMGLAAVAVMVLAGRR